MYIFIGNLPNQECQSEIVSLLKKFVNESQSEMKLTIQKHMDSYFCIVSISNEKKARKFIKKYNLKSPYGQQLVVREFIHRSYGNERRDINWRQKQWQGSEKRSIERRIIKPAFDL